MNLNITSMIAFVLRLKSIFRSKDRVSSLAYSIILINILSCFFSSRFSNGIIQNIIHSNSCYFSSFFFSFQKRNGLPFFSAMDTPLFFFSPFCLKINVFAFLGKCFFVKKLTRISRKIYTQFAGKAESICIVKSHYKVVS